MHLQASSTHALVLLKESFYQSPDFSLELLVMDYNAAHPSYSGSNPGLTRPLRIGTTELLSDIELLNQFAPPPPPSSDNTLDAYIFADNQYYFTYYKTTTLTENRWSIVANAPGSYYFVDWDRSSLSGVPGTFIARYEFSPGTITTVSMRETNRVAALNGTAVEIIHLFENDFTQIYNAGFQLISNPGLNPIEDPTSVFYPAQANSLYAFSGVYTDETTIQPGRGYWLRFTGQAEVTFSPPFRDYQVLGNMMTGWHLISGPGYPFSTSNISDPSNILVGGRVYGYTLGYQEVSMMEPGKGYWIQIDNSISGTALTFDARSSIGTQQKLQRTDPVGFTQLQLSTQGSDRTFYLDGDLNANPDIHPRSFDMPPMPPSEAFDVRFTNNGLLTEAIRGTIKVQSPTDDLTFKNTSLVSRRLILSIIRSGSAPQETYTLEPGDEIVVAGTGIREIEVESIVITSLDERTSDLPTQVTLRQNFPNPFNPTTTIAYTLPEESMVTLRVYDMLGRTVAVLVSDRKPAGFHTVTLNAQEFASGMYVYRLEAAGVTISRQMTLIK